MKVLATNQKGRPAAVELSDEEMWVADRHRHHLDEGFSLVQAAEAAFIDYHTAYPHTLHEDDNPIYWEFFCYLVKWVPGDPNPIQGHSTDRWDFIARNEDIVEAGMDLRMFIANIVAGKLNWPN